MTIESTFVTRRRPFESDTSERVLALERATRASLRFRRIVISQSSDISRARIDRRPRGIRREGEYTHTFAGFPPRSATATIAT